MVKTYCASLLIKKQLSTNTFLPLLTDNECSVQIILNADIVCRN